MTEDEVIIRDPVSEWVARAMETETNWLPEIPIQSLTTAAGTSLA